MFPCREDRRWRLTAGILVVSTPVPCAGQSARPAGRGGLGHPGRSFDYRPPIQPFDQFTSGPLAQDAADRAAGEPLTTRSSDRGVTDTMPATSSHR